MNNINRIFFVTFLIFISIFPILSLFHPGLPITHDGQDHVARIANFYKNLTEGNIIPRWAGNLNWGYGHPILEFLYPLPSYIASLFHFLRFPLVDSTKIVFGMGMILSFLFMYLWLSKFISKYSALFGAVLYTYAPYRFVELYVRGDIGENLAFAFVPLVLLFIYKIYKYNKFTDAIWGSFSLAFLILSHNAISLMFMPFVFLYCVMLVYFSKNKIGIFINLFFLFAMGFGMSAFFWIPGLLEGKYTLRNIVTKGEYLRRFVSLKDVLYGSWSYGGTGEFTVQFGPFAWISIVAVPFTLRKLNKNKEKLYLAILAFIYLLLAIFLMLSISNFVWTKILLLQNFQFPWRFLAITVFTTSVLGAIVVDKIPRRYQAWFSVLLIVLILVLSKDYMSPKGYLQNPEVFYTGIYEGTTDTGESAPIWSVRFMEKEPRANLEIVDGQANIKDLVRKSTYHKYHVVVNRKTIFRENTLYFPGWEVRANGKPVSIEFQVPHQNGTMEFNLDKGEYIIEAIYKETKLRLFANVVSLVCLGNITAGLIILFYGKVRYRKENL